MSVLTRCFSVFAKRKQKNEAKGINLISYLRFVEMLKAGIDELSTEPNEHVSQSFELYLEKQNPPDFDTEIQAQIDEISTALRAGDVEGALNDLDNLKQQLYRRGTTNIDSTDYRLKTVAIEDSDGSAPKIIPLISLLPPATPRFSAFSLRIDLNLFLNQEGELMVACTSLNKPINPRALRKLTALGRATQTVSYQLSQSDDEFYQNIHQQMKRLASKASVKPLTNNR
ncbi:hypothetical protein [Enterovibrio coralii]|uniref:Uncharacterized protein n=1 Tax=Enterovibrio coralii TaxID=294935 RepID=A0A135IA59_9GAMM|nr:hypothetical protein [Enterovibrio coralii]KXF82317.1 hypothetical protein ATN88_09130 [Enterovibrio coralii]